MSTNKTKNYGLHSWEAGDDFLRTEFNENFARLDDAIVVGRYRGDGNETQEIHLGFQPRAVIAIDTSGFTCIDRTCYGGLAIQDGPSRTTFVVVTPDGFSVAHNTEYYTTNRSGRTYYFVALK